jgi:hypothetical protein
MTAFWASVSADGWGWHANATITKARRIKVERDVFIEPPNVCAKERIDAEFK